MPKIQAPTLEQHRAETTDRLLDAWSELLMARGYADVSMADVAAHAGLARTAIYNYFADRESMLFAWTDREVRRTMAILEQELAESPTSAERLRSFVRIQVNDFANRHLPPGREVVQFLQPETYTRFMDHLEPIESALRKILREGVETGQFVDLPEDTAVRMIMACIGAERGPVASRAHSVADATEAVTGFLLAGLATADAATDG